MPDGIQTGWSDSEKLKTVFLFSLTVLFLFCSSVSFLCNKRGKQVFLYHAVFFYRVFRNYFYLALMFLSGSNPLGFSYTMISRLYKDWCEKEKISSEHVDPRGQRSYCFKFIRRQSNSNNYSLQLRYVQEHL